ncbi:MAG: hypothetical protein ACMG6H_10900, partial [Acidobacteriota bacterium]
IVPALINFLLEMDIMESSPEIPERQDESGWNEIGEGLQFIGFPGNMQSHFNGAFARVWETASQDHRL